MTDLETMAVLSVLAILGMKTAAEIRPLGQAPAPFLKAGDSLVLEGELGAGKTVSTQGLGIGLQVQRWVTSPTFIIARTHPVVPGSELVPLMHVDAYRLQVGDDIKSLGLDSALEDSIMVMKWGRGKAGGVFPHTLMVEITRPETTLLSGSDFADVLEDTLYVLTFRASAGARDLSGLPVAWETLVRQA